MTASTPSAQGAARRTLARVSTVLALAAVGVGVAAGPAGAHVLIETVEPHGDGISTITFTFDHGCDGEPTDTLRVTMPEGVELLAATQPDGWTSAVGGDGVTWSGEEAPVPDGERAAFTVDVRVTGEIGQSFAFPAVQECPSGASHDWSDTDPSGAHPAPTFVATAATLSTPTASPLPASEPPTPLGPLVAGVVGASVLAGACGAWAVRARRDRVV
ncbi:DUF1775 domain-containing protein [Cellulosimicrobium sp. PMB13]|uniref:DUF1775 domain-containing protein n=1 Tax=Cellulosimicrobium sp. PMB13 TaxID=3120158 RepID=UPI003F4C7861